MRRFATPLAFALIAFVGIAVNATAQAPGKKGAKGKKSGKKIMRGSLIEDRAARRLIAAGDARYDANEIAKAVEVWQSVIERYPKSRVRFTAHMKLGEHFLSRASKYDKARAHFEAVTAEENRSDKLRAEATLKMGVCFYHVRNHGKSFQIMRKVIEKFPSSPQVNRAYYYIGLGHFKLGHYSRAIAALEKVGATMADNKKAAPKLEAGKRLFIKIEDADLAVLDAGDTVKVRCVTTSGDEEIVECHPLGRNVRVVLGSVPSRLGAPKKSNGFLEVRGNDSIKVTYVDQQTAAKKVNQPVIRDVVVVGNANAQITDGAFQETLQGVVLGKGINIQVADADFDVSDKADKLSAAVEVYRRKSDDEIQAETAKIAANRDPEDDDEDGPKIDPWKRIDRAMIQLTEAKVNLNQYSLAKATAGLQDLKAATNTATANPTPDTNANNQNSGAIHSGIFRNTIQLAKAEKIIANDGILQAQPGDQIRLVYLDKRHRGEGVRQLVVKARCLEGNIGAVRVARAVINDQELRVKTRLNTAAALTNIGNRYKEFGLKRNADRKYRQALGVCDEVMTDARKLGGRSLEQAYVQLWKIYFEMDRLELAAAMCERLQREFPRSGFVDDAMLQLADVARKKGNLNRAIGIYNRLARMKTSQLRGEAQFGIAACYEAMADKTKGPGATQIRDRAFQEYKKVFEQFPESGRVGEAVAKMANYYYKQKDFRRAIDVFESVLKTHPDAKFLDVILFNYGRCLYRMGRRKQARSRFDQLIGEFPESPLAPDAKKISEALAKAGF